jgi:hypothetical protein
MPLKSFCAALEAYWLEVKLAPVEEMSVIIPGTSGGGIPAVGGYGASYVPQVGGLGGYGGYGGVGFGHAGALGGLGAYGGLGGAYGHPQGAYGGLGGFGGYGAGAFGVHGGDCRAIQSLMTKPVKFSP